MKNFISEGEMMEYSNAGAAIAAGEVVAFAWGCGVASVDIAATTGKGSIAVEGVFRLPKEAGLAISQGDIVYFDTGAKEVDKTNTNNKLGYASKGALAGDTHVEVKLVPSVG